MKSRPNSVSDTESVHNPPAEIAQGVAFPECPGELTHFTTGMLGPDDPLNPLNWSFKKKVIYLMAVSYVIMISSWGSAIGAPATTVLMKEFHVGLPVALLTVSFYVLGFAVGPVVWGPMSGSQGRKIPLFIGTFGLMLFMFAAGSAKDFQTLVLSRFFQGVFGASSLTVGPALAGDAFSSRSRGTSLTAVTFCVIAGPMIAPIVGGYIVQSYLGWRWTQYITGIMSALGCVMILFFPESYQKTLLQKKARELRNETGNWAIIGPEELDSLDFRNLIDQVILGPIKMLISEPILLLITLYHGLIYGILYMCLEAIPIVFGLNYHFPGANVYLPYIAALIGAAAVCAVNVVIFEPWYNKQMDKHKKSVLPESRLPLMILSGGIFCMGIFLMCWSGDYPKKVHWMVPMVGVGFIGFGIIGIFISAFNYILDTYLMQSAMAFAANTFLRSAFGCAFPLFVHPLFINLTVKWAGTLVGGLALLMFPVPVLFYIFGKRLRSVSPYAINLDDLPQKKDVESQDGDSEEDRSKYHKAETSAH